MKPKKFPNIDGFIGDIARQQAPTHHPDASPDDVVKARIRSQNATAEYICDLWNSFGQDRGEAKLVAFPEGSPAYAGSVPARQNVLIRIPRPNGTPLETRGIIGHFDNAPVNLQMFERMGKRPGEVHWHRQKQHVLYGWGAYDMQGGNYGTLRGSLEADIRDAEAETIIALACDEEGISSGAFALARDRHMRGIECMLSPEIAVMTEQVREDLLALTIGRNGRFGVKVTCNGVGMHAGEPSLENRPFLTENINRIAMKVLRNFAAQMHDHPNATDGLVLRPKVTITAWHSDDEQSLTTPSQSMINAQIFTAHPQETPDLVVERLRDAIAHALRTKLPCDESNDEHRRFLERAVMVELENRNILHYGRTPFAEPWREDGNHPFLQSVESLMMEGYRKSAALIPKIFGGMQALPKHGTQRMLDSGVSDENVYAMLLDAPIANVHLRGGRAHQPGEWLDIRSVPYWQYVVHEYMTAKGRLTDSKAQ